MRKVFVRDSYNYDVDEASNAAALVCESETRTQQQFKDECDINRIVRQFMETGEVIGNVRMPLQEDFVGVMDYHTAMNAVRRSQETFNALPARLRERFDNDAGSFVEFCLDPSNRDEAVSLGLIETVQSPTELSSPPPKAAPEGGAQ